MSKKKQLSLSILIISYNTADLTFQTLNSVFHSLSLSEMLDETEIIVVDNNSQDNSINKIEKIKSKFPNFKLIKNKDNLGFAKANNQASDEASGEYLLLLNSDTIVIGNALEELLNKTKDEMLGISAALLLNRDLSVQAQGGSLPNLFAVFSQMFFIDDLPFIGRFIASTQKTGKNFSSKTMKDKPNEVSAMGWVGGTAMLIRSSLWNKIGKLDEEIFMYGEDMELCLRAKKEKQKIGIINKAKIIHLGSASSSSKNAIIGELKGLIYIWTKHFPNWQRLVLGLILKIGVSLRILLFAIIGNRKKSSIYLDALKVV